VTTFGARTICILSVLGSILAAGVSVGEEANRLPWEGAWRWLNDTRDGRLILTSEHYFAVFARKDRTHLQDDSGSDADAAQLFRSMPGPMCGSVSFVETSAGVWDVSITPEVAANPRSVGHTTVCPMTVDGDHMVGQVLDDDRNVVSTWHYARMSDLGGRSILAGVWRVASDGKVGLMTLTDTEYRYVWSDPSRPAITKPTGDLTDEEAAFLCSAYVAEGGTYSVEGTTLSFSPEVARDPNHIGSSRSVRFDLTGETLTILESDVPQAWTRVQEF